MAEKKVKHKKARPFENLMLILASGKPMLKPEIAELLGWQAERNSGVKGPKIYNVSSYIWDIKNLAHVRGETIVVKSIREGKTVVGYQIAEKSVSVARKYLENRGLLAPAKKKKAPEPEVLETFSSITVTPIVPAVEKEAVPV